MGKYCRQVRLYLESVTFRFCSWCCWYVMICGLALSCWNKQSIAAKKLHGKHILLQALICDSEMMTSLVHVWTLSIKASKNSYILHQLQAVAKLSTVSLCPQKVAVFLIFLNGIWLFNLTFAKLVTNSMYWQGYLSPWNDFHFRTVSVFNVGPQRSGYSVQLFGLIPV